MAKPSKPVRRGSQPAKAKHKAASKSAPKPERKAASKAAHPGKSAKPAKPAKPGKVTGQTEMLLAEAADETPAKTTTKGRVPPERDKKGKEVAPKESAAEPRSKAAPKGKPEPEAEPEAEEGKLAEIESTAEPTVYLNPVVELANATKGCWKVLDDGTKSQLSDKEWRQELTRLLERPAVPQA